MPCPPPGGSSQPRDQTQVSCIAGIFFYHLSHQESSRNSQGTISKPRQPGCSLYYTFLHSDASTHNFISQCISTLAPRGYNLRALKQQPCLSLTHPGCHFNWSGVWPGHQDFLKLLNRFILRWRATVASEHFRSKKGVAVSLSSRGEE